MLTFFCISVNELFWLRSSASPDLAWFPLDASHFFRAASKAPGLSFPAFLYRLPFACLSRLPNPLPGPFRLPFPFAHLQRECKDNPSSPLSKIFGRLNFYPLCPHRLHLAEMPSTSSFFQRLSSKADAKVRCLFILCKFFFNFFLFSLC